MKFPRLFLDFFSSFKFQKQNKMTDKVKCLTCEKKSEASLTKSCHNCDSIYCALCIMKQSTDSQQCGCDWLCETCREGPQECKGCSWHGCRTCMTSPCTGCQGHGVEETLLCDDCIRKCYTCKNEFCEQHVRRQKITYLKGGKSVSKIHIFCWKCMESALSAYVKADKETKENSNKRKRTEEEELKIDV